MGEPTHKLSLVSQFDDLCRHQAVLNDGLELEFLKFVRNQEQCRLRWLQSDRELKSLQAEYETTVQELGEWKHHYEDMRKKLSTEQKRRTEAERKLNEMYKLFGEVKEVVNRDNTLADQTKEKFAMWQRYPPMDAIQEDDLADRSSLYDKTEDDLDLQEVENESRPKRRSSARISGFTPPKRQKSEELFVVARGSTSVVATTTVHVGPERGGEIIATSKINTFPSAPVPPTAPELPTYTPQSKKQKRRSHSEPEAIIIVEPPSHEGFRQIINSDPNPDRLYPTLSGIAQQENSQIDANSNKITPKMQPRSSMPFRHQNSGSKLSNRAHDFASKTVIRPETCLPCGRRIKFSKQALKCHNCRATCHPECKSSVPLPCIPVNHTPTSKTGRLTLADFASKEPPFIPALIIFCVNEIENRGFSEVGLYRLSAPERDVKELKEKFLKGKGIPNVSRIDVHVMCAVIKDFLRNIETLIPRTMWKEFTDAAANNDHPDSLTAFYQGISQLPLPNRDTLAYLILHWQRVAETPEVKMPIKNLATVLGPTVVGFSSNTLNSSTMLREQVLQVKVVEKLLQISSEYWNSFLNVEENSQLFPSLLKPSDLITPEPRSAKRLAGSATLAQPSAVTRVGSMNSRRPGNRPKFFASPVLRN